MNPISKLIACALFLSSTVALSQNAYYDAFYLQSQSTTDRSGEIRIRVNAENIRSLEEVFRRYGLTGDYSSDEELYNAMSDLLNKEENPLISFKSYGQSNFSDRSISGVSEKAKSIGASVSGFNVSTVADGLAKFLVKRAKQELTMAFFEKFKEDLENYAELKILFPQTFDLLEVIGEEIYNFSGYLNMLREAFQFDLQNLIPHLKQLINEENMAAYLKTNPTVDFILGNALLIADDLQNGVHPGDMLTNISNENLNYSTVRNLSPSLQVMNLISQSLTSKQADQYWISSDSLQLLFRNETTMKVYLGLIYQLGKNITFENKRDQSYKLGTYLMALSENYNEYIPALSAYIKKINQQTEIVDRNLKTINRLNEMVGQKSGYADHYAFYTSVIDMVGLTVSISQVQAIAKEAYFDLAKFDQFIEIARQMGNLYLDVQEKNYFGAVMSLSVILDKTIPKQKEKLDEAVVEIQRWTNLVNIYEDNDLTVVIDNIRRFAEEQDQSAEIDELLNALTILSATVNGNNREAVKKIMETIKGRIANRSGQLDRKILERYTVLLKKIMKYGNLASSIAKAENSDEVEKIIETIALPAGSASIKKKTDFSVGLNAYVGLSPGYEYSGDTEEWAVIFGVHTPVGIAFNWGKNKNENEEGVKAKHVSNSLFLSVIDVTAFSVLRFNDSETSELPEVSLSNIFAPGLYYVRGVAKLPVSWGIGGQLGPQLRTIESTTITTGDGVTFSGKFFIAVDIPIINFYSKSK
ncbi:MAG: hypothetical protein ABJF11_02185 [Reichenbachiella sp.]|uniref:hypothetical protein n=1 Tax=Reichenbachiella sp. TaxID=2184521 RepID=UPI003264E969